MDGGYPLARAISPRAVASTRVNRNRHQGVLVKELDVRCRKSLGRYMPVMSIMRRERQLLQILKFDERFYTSKVSTTSGFLKRLL